MRNRLRKEGVCLDMRRSRQQETLATSGGTLPVERVRDFRNFARSMDAFADADELLRTLPAALATLFAAHTAAVICVKETGISGFAANAGGGPIEAAGEQAPWYEEIRRLTIERPELFLLPALEHEMLLPETLLPDTVRFFRELGNRSLCLLPLSTALRRLGVLCVASESPDAFSEDEIGLLSMVSDYVALAIDDRLNFARSEAARLHLESERTKLNLILDLNNSVVSNLDLREVLRSVSPGIRRTMRVDGVALMLPDAAGTQLRLHVLDFPDGKGVVGEGVSRPVDGSLPGQVLRSGMPWVGDLAALHRSGFEDRISAARGIQAVCILPLMRCRRALGVLCLIRLRKASFTPDDVEFLTQIAGQVAIALDNAFAYQQISELRDRLTQEKLYLEDEIRSEMNFEEIIGNSAVLRRVLDQVEAVAPTNSTVLIQGETGSGKELIARAVHKLSHRNSHPFVKLNCAAIPTGLLESELFGHERGAFTGAINQRIGRFELASQGTIFLDEISEIPLDLQPKLLRVLQEREFERLGSSRTLRTDARLVAATNRDLHAMVAEQRFRSDLFYRLNVFPIHVPPLRERREDIPFLVRHFAQHFARNMSKNIETISSETMNALIRYPWPGNIRELQNLIERAVILSKGPVLNVSLADLKSKTQNGAANGSSTLAEVERRHILSVLEETNWVFAGPNGAAARLGVKRPTLQFRMQKLGISRPRKA
ncbi:MAG: Sigma-54 dependent transcriptional regulator (Modular protein) [Acidobacteriaceae bacterium]|nr:Sigma-54 dependent transcriptional regulator (Modular protein) [Acidobacteriaceae bacterium]